MNEQEQNQANGQNNVIGAVVDSPNKQDVQSLPTTDIPNVQSNIQTNVNAAPLDIYSSYSNFENQSVSGMNPSVSFRENINTSRGESSNLNPSIGQNINPQGSNILQDSNVVDAQVNHISQSTPQPIVGSETTSSTIPYNADPSMSQNVGVQASNILENSNVVDTQENHISQSTPQPIVGSETASSTIPYNYTDPFISQNMGIQSSNILEVPNVVSAPVNDISPVSTQPIFNNNHEQIISPTVNTPLPIDSEVNLNSNINNDANQEEIKPQISEIPAEYRETSEDDSLEKRNIEGIRFLIVFGIIVLIFIILLPFIIKYI